MTIKTAPVLGLILLWQASAATAAEQGAAFDDSVIAKVEYPAWFKDGFMELPQDLADAVEAGKTGLFLFVSTEGCSYCHLFLQKSLGDPEIAARVQAHFDTLGLEIFDDRELTDFAGAPTPVKEFVLEQGVQFAPTLLFYAPDETGAARLLARLPGYYEPERFDRVLDYLIEGHWRERTLKDHLARTAPTPEGDEDRPAGLQSDPLFAAPPYALDRSGVPAERPLVVIFESADCPRCPRFHREVLGNADIRATLSGMEVVRLDAADGNTPVITPEGRRTTPAEWYAALGFSDLPALAFYSEDGRNVLQSDALVLTSRMTNSLGFLRERAYERGWTYQRYARSQSMARHASGAATTGE